MSSRKQQFLDTFEKEHERTMRVLHAYPPGRDNLTPHPKSPSARELAWKISMGQGMMVKALTTGFDWSKPLGAPAQPPGTVAEIADRVEQQYERVVETLRDFDESKLDETVQFFVAPKKLGDYRKEDFLWFLLFDQIHHRGQFSVYLRMADGDVPSIYGPSGDEPWM